MLILPQKNISADDKKHAKLSKELILAAADDNYFLHLLSIEDWIYNGIRLFKHMKYQDFFYFKTKKGSVNGGSIANTSKTDIGSRNTQHSIKRQTNLSNLDPLIAV